MEGAVVFADTFLDAMTQLSVRGKAYVVDFLARFCRDPEDPRLRIEKLQAAPGYYSALVGRQGRAILSRGQAGIWCLHYVDMHDPAYRWAERRDLNGIVGGVIQLAVTEETLVEADEDESDDEMVDLSSRLYAICGSAEMVADVLETLERR